MERWTHVPVGHSVMYAVSWGQRYAGCAGRKWCSLSGFRRSEEATLADVTREELGVGCIGSDTGKSCSGQAMAGARL